MKLILHIIAKDIVRDRWALLTWSLLIAGQALIGVFARNFSGIDAEWVISLQVASVVLVFLQMTMGYLLVARLVQADPLIGTSMFWPTRPISRGRLLLAKLLGALLLFVVLPVLLLLPWWLYCQFSWREILWTAIVLAGWQLLVVAPAFLVASLTDDLGRVLMWTLLLLIGLTSWIVLLQSTLVRAPVDMLGIPGAAIMFTRLWVCSLVLIGVSLAVAVHQFLTRRFVRSVVLAVFGLGLVALTGQLWSRNWTRAFASLHEPALAPLDPKVSDAVAFAIEPAVGSFGGGFKGKGDPGKTDAALNLRLRVSGLPEDLGIAVEDYLGHTWSWANGTKLTRWSGYFWWNDSPGNAALRRAYSLPVPERDAETERWKKTRWERARAERGLKPMPYPYPGWPDRPSAPEPKGRVLRGYVNLPNSLLAKMKAEPPAYRADGHWMLYRPDIVVELPLKDGARAASQGFTFHLRKMNGTKPLVISTHSTVTSYGAWFSMATIAEFRHWFLRERFVTVNRVTGDIGGVWEGQAGSQTLQVAGVIVTWKKFQVSPRIIIRNDQDLPADPQWLEHTFLAFLVDRDIGRFDRTVETAKFELAPDKTPEAGEP